MAADEPGDIGRFSRSGPVAGGDVESLYGGLWDAVSAIRVPVLLARGMRSDSVLGDDDEEELRRRLPSARVVHVEGAGHHEAQEDLI